TSIRHPKEDSTDPSYLLTALGKLWLEGQSPDWTAFQEGSRRRIALPTYPFERKRYWVDAALPVSANVESPTATSAEKPRGDKQPDVADWFYRPVWKSEPLTTSEQTLEGDTLIFADEIGLGRRLAETLGRLPGTPSAAPFELTFPTAGDPDDARLVDIER